MLSERNKKLLDKIDEKLLESLGYKVHYKPADDKHFMEYEDVEFLCCGEPVTQDWCMEHCEKFEWCGNYASADDAYKLLFGEVDDDDSFYYYLHNVELTIEELEAL